VVENTPRKRELFEVPKLPSGKIDIRELIDRRKSAFARKDAAAEARKLIKVKVRGNDPIAVTLLGDPHVDDDHTDLGQLERDIEVIKRTPGLYAACIGDLQNNWIGRLARLYGEQATIGAAEATRCAGFSVRPASRSPATTLSASR
jgi:hypothetical protein